MEDRLQVLKRRMEELTGKILGTAKEQEKIPPKQEQPKTSMVHACGPSESMGSPCQCRAALTGRVRPETTT